MDATKREIYRPKHVSNCYMKHDVCLSGCPSENVTGFVRVHHIFRWCRSRGFKPKNAWQALTSLRLIWGFILTAQKIFYLNHCVTFNQLDCQILI